MRSKWQISGRGEDTAPVEMRFVDMFMTALGSLLFLALLLVLLLPKNAEFLTGRIVAKEKVRRAVVAQGKAVDEEVTEVTVEVEAGAKAGRDGPKRVKVFVHAKTELGRAVQGTRDDLEIGRDVIVAGKSALDGTLTATMVQTREPFAGRQVTVTGTIAAADDGSITVRRREGGTMRVTLDLRTDLAQDMPGRREDLVVGRDVVAVGTGQADGSVAAHLVHVATVMPVAAVGKVVAVEGQTITVELKDGGRKRIAYGGRTEISEDRQGSSQDLAPEKQVVVIGQPRSDGAIDATAIHIAAPTPVALIGRVAGTGPGTLRLALPDGRARDVMLVDGATKIHQNLSAGERDLQTGRDVMVIGKTGADGSFLATDVHVAVDTQVFLPGKITARDDKGFTVAVAGLGDRVVSLGQATEVRQSSPGSVAELEQGKEVMVGGSMKPDGSIEASVVHFRAVAPPPRDLVAVIGKVVQTPQPAGTRRDSLTLQTAEGERRLVRFDAGTEMRQDGGPLSVALAAGTEVLAVGKPNPRDGSIAATVLQVRPAPMVSTTGRIAAKSGQTLTMELPGGGRVSVAIGPSTQIGQNGTASASDVDRGKEVTAVGRPNADGSIQAAMLQLNDRSRMTVSEYERTIKSQQEEIDRLKQLLKNHQTEHVNVLRRGFGLGLMLLGCQASEVFFYVHVEATIANAFTGENPRKTVGFDSVKQARETLFGERYSELETQQKDGFLLFHAVARGDHVRSAYVALRKPAAFGSRECVVTPVFVTHERGIQAGHSVVLSQQRPFAWLRRFRINNDGTNTLGLEPKDDTTFRRELAVFSQEQSLKLCESGYPWRTEDAHLAVLGSSGSSSKQPLTPCPDLRPAPSPDVDGRPAAAGDFDIKSNSWFGSRAGYARLEARSVADCEKHCREDGKCVAFEVLTPTLHALSGACHLHSSMAEVRSIPDWKLGIKRSPAAAQGKFDVHAGKAFKWRAGGPNPQLASSVEQCQQRCEASAACLGYTYFRNTSDPGLLRYCRLVEAPAPELEADSRAESGVKPVR